jgi:hypothetical protein
MQYTPSNAVSVNTDVDLHKPGALMAIKRQLAFDIETFSVREFDDGHRNHLGGSLIGHECKRYLWYVFRWCHHTVLDGRRYRLFNRGHREEPAFVRLLEGIGCEVYTHDPVKLDSKGEPAQYRVSSVGGHFGGSLDAVLKLPARYNVAAWLLGEFKTNGTGAGFNKLVSDGIALGKPQHYAQTSTYGYLAGLHHGVYLNTNKNDDDLHIEVFELNHRHGANMVAKAEIVIRSPRPPAKLSETPTYVTCQMCDMKGICHKGEPYDKNCRSCRFAEPQPGPIWYCHVHKGTIPDDVIKIGCPYYESAK